MAIACIQDQAVWAVYFVFGTLLYFDNDDNSELLLPLLVRFGIWNSLCKQKASVIKAWNLAVIENRYTNSFLWQQQHCD